MTPDGLRLLAPAALALLLAGCAPRGPFTEPEEVARPAEGTHLARGFVLLRAGEPDRAHKAFIRAYRLGEADAVALTGAGMAMEQLGLLSRAREYFEAARDLAPDSAVAQNNLGVVLYRLGDYSRAAQAFRAAYAVSSGRNDIARVNLESAEAALAARMPPPADPALTHRVTRMGSSEYLLEPLPALSAGEPGPSPAGTPGP